MPYIDKADRNCIGEDVIATLAQIAHNVPSRNKWGALKHVAYQLAFKVYQPKGYTDTSEMIASIRDAANELQRRLVERNSHQQIITDCFIDDEDKKHIGEKPIAALALLIGAVPSGKIKGALNYTTCRLAMQVCQPIGYIETCEMFLTLRAAADELQQELLDPYEDKVIVKNGDVPEITKYLEDAAKRE